MSVNVFAKSKAPAGRFLTKSRAGASYFRSYEPSARSKAAWSRSRSVPTIRRSEQRRRASTSRARFRHAESSHVRTTVRFRVAHEIMRCASVPRTIIPRKIAARALSSYDQTARFCRMIYRSRVFRARSYQARLRRGSFI